MTIRRLLSLSLLIPALVSAQAPNPTTAAIDAVLDDFHDAAAHGDKTRYLDHMTEDAVFMGTDEWERCLLYTSPSPRDL